MARCGRAFRHSNISNWSIIDTEKVCAVDNRYRWSIIGTLHGLSLACRVLKRIGLWKWDHTHVIAERQPDKMVKIGGL